MRSQGPAIEQLPDEREIGKRRGDDDIDVAAGAGGLGGEVEGR